MPSDRTISSLNEILYHIDLAILFLDTTDVSDFQQDLRSVYAVTRCLEIISEASRRLPDDLKARHPTTEWRQIADAGNVYRHEYEAAAPRIIWETVRSALPVLRIVIAAELQALEASIHKA